MALKEDDLTGIHAVAERLGVTPRTLRLYEDRGLIQPIRIGTNRAFSRRDVARIQLILRGKRLGFSLREIEEFLDLYDTEPGQLEQMRILAEKCRMKLEELSAQRLALDQTMRELQEIEAEARQRLTDAG